MKELSELMSWVDLINSGEPGSHFNPTKHVLSHFFVGVHVKLLSSNLFGVRF